MTLDQFIQFIIRNNSTIIESLVGLVVVLVVFLAYRTFLSAKNAGKWAGAGAAGLGAMGLVELEETLKKVLEKASALPGNSGEGSGDQSALLAQISEMKQSLLAKQAELEAAKAATAGAAPSAGGISDAEKAALETQLKDLQGKLAEYEIISEDIADLSFYKEENAKLQKELESAKAGGASSAPSAAAPAPPVAAPPPPAPAAVTAAPELAGPTAPPAEAPVDAAPAVAIDDDIMAQFAAAVDDQKALTAAAAPAADAASTLDDDIMKEFAAAVNEQKSSGAATTAPPVPAVTSAVGLLEGEVDLGAMDMDKMASEAGSLPEAADAAISDDVLNASLNAEKLLAEASGMEGPSQEDANLMKDFEKFAKKG